MVNVLRRNARKFRIAKTKTARSVPAAWIFLTVARKASAKELPSARKPSASCALSAQKSLD